MTDQCKHCLYRGDLKTCLAAECFHHENWYAVEQQKRINILTATLKEIKVLAGGSDSDDAGEMDSQLCDIWLKADEALGKNNET